MKGWLIPLYFVLFSLFFSYNASAPTRPSCPHDQSLALIQFSNSFSIQCSYFYPWCGTVKTMSWKKGTDCCSWEGVKCVAATGNVMGLDLSCSCLAGPFPSNSTLFRLRHLQELNLAGNDFYMSPIATQFGELTGLTHLNISASFFTGKIPPEISHLSKLLSLDLSSTNYGDNLVLERHVFENMVGNMTQLRHLLLSFVNMSSVVPTSFLNMSSHVRTIILDNNGFQGNFPDSIHSLRSLETLDLSSNCLKGPIPVSLANLTQLKYLNLQSNLLTGPILFSFSHFKRLTYLDLSLNDLEGQISDSFGNLTELFHLSLSGNKLSGVLPVSAFNLPQVQVLDLSGNKLVGSLPSQISGFSRLAELRLNENFLNGRIPSLLFSLPSLVELRLYNNKLTGPIEQFDKIVPLEAVDLSNNAIQGPIPASFSQLVNLTLLDLSFNNLSGSFELDKLSKLGKLEHLSFSNNALLSLSSASNADYSLPNLVELDLSSCNTSKFPNFVRNLQGLTSLDLSYNRIHVIKADMFLKLQSLQSLDLSHNSPLFVSNNSKVSLVLPNLSSLSLSSCNITEFSNFLTTQEGLTRLDLSNNRIQGRITKQETNWGSNLTYLDLSGNLLTLVEYSSWKNLQVLNLGSNLLKGPLLPPPTSASVFLISKNRLTGEIPSSICNLYYSEMEVVLDLSHNNLSGTIPKCLGLKYSSVLDLQMNHLHGNIPDFCVEENYMLQTLNLNNNEFDGPLPKTLANCYDLEVLNLGNNRINDTFPHWLGTLPQLQVLVLRANYFHGQIIHLENGPHFSTLRIFDLSHNEFSGLLPKSYFQTFQGMMSAANVQMGYIQGEYYQDSMVVTMKGVDIELERILTIFATLDMSSNRFGGTIPETIGNLISLQVLNFSHNHLTGHIPSTLGNVAALESLDLSCNKLVGEIPPQLVGLNFLEVLNLSENHLVGLIPQGNQFNTFPNDSYIGNIGLCGFPVSKGCGNSETPPATFEEQEADSAFGLGWKSVMMGYGCGMVFGFSAGYIMMTIRKPKWLVVIIQGAGNKVLGRFNKYL